MKFARDLCQEAFGDVEFSTAQENRTWLIAVSYTILRWGLAHFVGLHMK
jgi:hypothetical protein